MKKKKNLTGAGGIMIILVLVVALVPFLGSCGPEEVAPIEEEVGPIGEVWICSITDLTGPTASTCRPHLSGLMDYFTYLEETQGGIRYNDPKTGEEEVVKVNWDWGDNKAQSGPCPTIFKRLMQRNPVAFFFGSTGAVEACIDLCDEAKVPSLSTISLRAYHPTKEYTFCIQPDYASQAMACANWALEDWHKKGNAGAPKWAWFTLDIPYGRATLTKECTDYLTKELGMEIVGEWFMPFHPVDTTAEFSAILDTGANYVHGQIVSNQAQKIMRDMTGMGIKDKLTFLTTSFAITEATTRLAGPDADGLVGSLVMADTTELEKPGVKLSAELAERYVREFDVDYIYATSFGITMAEAVKRALEEKGYPITGEDVKNVMNAFKDFDPGGTAYPITWTPTEHRPNMNVRIGAIQDGKTRAITDYVPCPDMRPRD